jgi:hypothetical protein
MPNRVQAYAFGIGSAKQVDSHTISTGIKRFRQLSQEVDTIRLVTETDANEIGKGNEFISKVYLDNWAFQHRFQKVTTAEFTALAWCYALGNVGLASSLYTAVPQDPGVSLELPYTSFVAQLAEGGGMAVDEALIGVQVEEVSTTFSFGPTRNDSTTSVTLLGTGRHVFPSGVSLPAALAENELLSATLSLSLLGHDYVADSSILSGTISWKNNLLERLMYRPGSGVQDGAAVGSTIFFGPRVPSLQITAFLKATSPELAALIAQTPGTASLKLQKDATHFVQWDLSQVSLASVDRTSEEGLVAVSVNAAIQFKTSDSTILTFTSKNDLTDICQ